MEGVQENILLFSFSEHVAYIHFTVIFPVI